MKADSVHPSIQDHFFTNVECSEFSAGVCSFHHINEHIKKYKFIARILILKTYGSVPRNEGTSMLVWSGGQLGTIGGVTLEYQATQSAIKILNSDMGSTITKLNLGPDMGQCCGGSVELLSLIHI